MNLKNLSYWQKQSYFKSVDLTIVGAGFTGLWAAYHFLERFPGANVQIFESGPFPMGASIKNAGFSCFGSAGELAGDLEEHSVDHLLLRMEQRVKGLAYLLERVPRKAMDYQASGGLEIFTDPIGFAKVNDKLDFLNQLIAPITEEKETYNLKKVWGEKDIYCKMESMLNPGKLIQYLSENVAQKGARFHFGCEVVEVKSGYVWLKNVPDPIPSECILLATNGYSHNLVPSVAIQPTRNYVMLTQPLPKIPIDFPVHHHQGFVYFRPLDGRLLMGGGRHISLQTEFTSSQEIPDNIKEWLINFAKENLHLDLANKIAMEWTGTMGYLEDKTPKCLKTDENVYWIGGYSGMGVGPSAHLSKEWVKDL
ncbi:NAD(P)/FAD-dependent oxidoreductase [Pleomorphovibrio marinus]|uniref:NAD(P)/FAD-dependent oxidoreductase n=1 Tax=Pleomorphovibrio marinus TaxID=2164132 RepID=UPI000E0AA9C4|nr:FAD-dependent oxidoreductase [Pleomorphovibrio marinus]